MRKATLMRALVLVASLAATLADDTSLSTDDEHLCAYLTGADPNDGLCKDLAVRLAIWDAAEDGAWRENTEPNTPARRAHVISLLGLGENAAKLLLDKFPIAAIDGAFA